MTPTALLSSAALQFESLLGDPLDSAHVMSWASAMWRDEAESYPADALELLHSHGISRFHIPAGYGGSLESFEQLFALSRALGRRDPSVGLTAGMQIWSQLIWIGGSAAQQALMRDVLLADLYPCLAVSEEMHGADVVAGAVTAHESGAGIRLNGTKWLVGLARRSVLALVLARTAGLTGYRGLSWYLVEKSRLAADSCKPLPKVRTMGMRAAEISGLNFDDAELPPDAPISEAGRWAAPDASAVSEYTHAGLWYCLGRRRNGTAHCYRIYAPAPALRDLRRSYSVYTRPAHRSLCRFARRRGAYDLLGSGIQHGPRS